MILETLIIAKLNQIIPQFDEETDRKMLDIVQSDLLNYLKVIYNLNTSLDARAYFMQELANQGVSVRDEMEAFISLWYRCWKHRVKLIFTDDEFNRNAFQVQHLIRLGSSHLSKDEFEELRKPIIEFLILHGEYACTNLVSDQVLRQELGRYGKPVKTIEDKCNFESKALSNIRRLLMITGPLVFIKVNKIYGGKN